MKAKYPFLDGLRAIAILMVFYEHIHHYILVHQYDPWNDRNLSSLYLYFDEKWHWDLTNLIYRLSDLLNGISSGQGVLGVDLFFIISGFLITRLLLGNFKQKINIWRFYCRRFWKIYPSYFCLIFVTFGVVLINSHVDLKDFCVSFLTYLFFLQSSLLNNAQSPVSLGHTWSLVVEEQFYLFYPLMAFIVFKITPSAQFRRRILLCLALAVLIIAPYIRFHFNLEQNPWMLPLYHFDALASGCILALLEPLLMTMAQWKKLGFIFWLIGATLYIYLIFIYDWNSGWNVWYVYNFSDLAAVCIFIAGYLGVTFLSGLKILQWLGRHSYGIYLWHYPVLFIFINELKSLPLPFLIFFYALTAILAGIISTRTVEKYFLNLREKIVP